MTVDAQKQDGDSADDSRRNIFAALMGVVGLAALSGCDDGTDRSAEPCLARSAAALSGGNVIQFDTMANLRGGCPALC